MEITGGLGTVGRSTRLRLSSFLVAFALLAGSLLLIQHRADASPAPAVAAAVAGPSVGSAQFQIPDFFAILCAILLEIRNAFAGTPFGGFVTPILNQFLIAFGCAPSG